MFDAKARVAARCFFLYLFVDAEDFINGEVAVRVSGELPSGGMSLSRNLQQLFTRCNLQSRVVRNANVRLRQPRRALGDGTIGILLYTSDAQPIVAESGVNASFRKVWQVGDMY